MKSARASACESASSAKAFAAAIFLPSPPGEADGLYINFCDPWPKARHAKRRLTHRAFLERYRRILRPGGLLIFKTDNPGLFDFSLEEFASAGLKAEDVSYDLHAENRPDNIETEYEKKFSGFGEKIHRCVVRFP